MVAVVGAILGLCTKLAITWASANRGGRSLILSVCKISGRSDKIDIKHLIRLKYIGRHSELRIELMESRCSTLSLMMFCGQRHSEKESAVDKYKIDYLV